MSKEFRIGLLSVIALAGMIWLFQYLKGRNILKKVVNFEVVYDNIEGLKLAAPVEINGYVIGSISDISLNPDDVRSMLITFDIQGEYHLPISTRAILAADNSLVGTKKIILEFDYPCTGQDCAKSGQRLEPGYRGILEAIVGKEDLKSYLKTIRTEMGPVVDTLISHLTEDDADNAISHTLKSLDISMSNLASLTSSMDKLMSNTYDELNTTVENMATITSSLASTNTDMEQMIRNFSELSQQLVDANLGESLSKTSETFDNTNALLEDFQETVKKANTSFETMSDILSKVEDGEGSLAKLLNDSTIYNNLESTSKHLSLLLQDLRLNPKRYVRLSVFGRKGNPYVPPEEDPALSNDAKNQ